MNKYDDIINLPHYISKKHTHMSREARAVQFAPFAALSGYGEAIRETARITDDRLELDDEMKRIINDKLNVINNCIWEKPCVTFTYYVSDKRKDGGSYETTTGNVKKIDLINNLIILTNSKKINILDLIGISGI